MDLVKNKEAVLLIPDSGVFLITPTCTGMDLLLPGVINCINWQMLMKKHPYRNATKPIINKISNTCAYSFNKFIDI